MTESIFSRAYKYKQTGDKHNSENYTTEIFAFCLKHNEGFRNEFIEKINIDKSEGNEGFKVRTQSSHKIEIKKEQSEVIIVRPDVEITTENAKILIECKIEAGLGNNQLENYASLLNDEKFNKPTKILIFLTKYNYMVDEPSTIGKSKFVRLTWSDILAMITEQGNANDVLDVLQNFKKFLMKENIAIDKIDNKFDKDSIAGLRNLFKVINQMDFVIRSLQGKEIAGKTIDFESKEEAILSKFKEDAYYYTIDKGTYQIQIGFMWWWKHEEEHSDNMRLVMRVRSGQNGENYQKLRNYYVDNQEKEKKLIEDEKKEYSPYIEFKEWKNKEKSAISIGYSLRLDVDNKDKNEGLITQKPNADHVGIMTLFLQDYLSEIEKIIKEINN